MDIKPPASPTSDIKPDRGMKNRVKNSVLYHSIERTRGKYHDEDFHALRHTSLVLFNTIVRDLRDGSSESSWIDVVLDAGKGCIKSTPTMRDRMFHYVQRERQEIQWRHVMPGRSTSEAETYEQLTRKQSMLKDVVYRIVIKMYELSVEYEDTKDLNESQIALYDKIKVLRRRRAELHLNFRKNYRGVHVNLAWPLQEEMGALKGEMEALEKEQARLST